MASPARGNRARVLRPRQRAISFLPRGPQRSNNHPAARPQAAGGHSAGPLSGHLGDGATPVTGTRERGPSVVMCPPQSGGPSRPLLPGPWPAAASCSAETPTGSCTFSLPPPTMSGRLCKRQLQGGAFFFLLIPAPEMGGGGGAEGQVSSSEGPFPELFAGRWPREPACSRDSASRGAGLPPWAPSRRGLRPSPALPASFSCLGLQPLVIHTDWPCPPGAGPLPAGARSPASLLGSGRPSWPRSALPAPHADTPKGDA